MNVEIITGNRKTIITDRANESSFGQINHDTSTSPLPLIAINFVDGKQVGGTTISKDYADRVIAAALAKGMTIIQL